MFDCGAVKVGPLTFFEKKDDILRQTSSNDANERKVGTTEQVKTKNIYLIRHAESNENHRLDCLSRSIATIGKFSLPSKEDVTTSFELIDIKGQIDSDVSEKGHRQIKQLREKLQNDNFISMKKIQMVAHSPLKRARQTSQGLLGCVTKNPELKGFDSSWEGQKAPTVNRIVQLPFLMERTIFEWIPIKHDAFMERINEFESWLDMQPEENIAIVGHSQYFKSMLQLSYKFDNCDVIQINYTPRSSSNDSFRGWGNLRKLYFYDED